MPTTDRLLEAAVDVFAERGFGQATISEIARRAEISGPAVYKHFGDKAELLLAAAKRSLRQMSSATDAAALEPRDIAQQWLSPGFSSTRRLILELHLTAGREAEVLELLAEWHLDRASSWMREHSDSVAQVKAFYLLLLGLAQTDSLSALNADPAEVREHVGRMVGALFPARPDPT